MKKLTSVDELTKGWSMFKDLPNDIINYDNYKVEDVQKLIIDDRNQAYTSLVEGIEGMEITKKVMHDHEYIVRKTPEEILTDIIAKVVKPLYDKKTLDKTPPNKV